MFSVGDTVVHPSYGAGVVTDIKTLAFLGNKANTYYSLQLLSEPGTVVMVAVRDEEKVGLRPPIPKSELHRVWRILSSDPEVLPSDHNERYAVLKEKLHGGDALEVAEALRDLAWRREQKRSLTTEGKRLYELAMRFLSAEIAVAEGSDMSRIEGQISQSLQVQAV
jgi:RNA polymerase-interacting CarD/CdnL/TRCF family regulator